MFPENNSGIIWFLGCVVILTLSGVFLSILVDKRLDHSSRTQSFTGKLDVNEAVVEQLEAELESGVAKMEKAGSTADEDANRIYDLKRELNTMAADVASLKERKEEITSSLPVTRQRFAEYRETYRKTTWREASGEKIDHIFLKSGRQFENVVISRVTEFGLEISHSHGHARIDFKDLGNDYRDRFQWNDAERQAILERERLNRERLAVKASPERAKPLSSAIGMVNKTSVPINSELPALQTKVSALKIKVSGISASHANALSQSRYGKQRSVPGSLRTWAEQAAILENELTKTRILLNISMAELRMVSPQDPLLRHEPMGTGR